MAKQDPWTALDSALAALPAHDAEAARVERLRERCLARLAAARQGRERRGHLRAGRWLEPAVALGLGALYLAAVVPRALSLLR